MRIGIMVGGHARRIGIDDLVARAGGLYQQLVGKQLASKQIGERPGGEGKTHD